MEDALAWLEDESVGNLGDATSSAWHAMSYHDGDDEGDEDEDKDEAMWTRCGGDVQQPHALHSPGQGLSSLINDACLDLCPEEEAALVDGLTQLDAFSLVDFVPHDLFAPIGGDARDSSMSSNRPDSSASTQRSDSATTVPSAANQGSVLLPGGFKARYVGSQCERNELCVRGFRHLGRGGHCRLGPLMGHPKTKVEPHSVRVPPREPPMTHPPPVDALKRPRDRHATASYAPSRTSGDLSLYGRFADDLVTQTQLGCVNATTRLVDFTSCPRQTAGLGAGTVT